MSIETDREGRSEAEGGRCWILLGMMGAGKSTVGKFLAERARRPFYDVDSMLQHRFGRPVHQVFAVYGEDAFRCHETSILRAFQPSACVLSTGGGIVVREENWLELSRLGITLYLSASTEVLRERLQASRKRRPLLEVEDWEAKLDELLERRIPLYQQADVILDVSSISLEEAAAQAYELLTAKEALMAGGAG